MSLYIARHGETDWNVEKRLQSHSDIPLNSRGREQAQLLRQLLINRGVQFGAAFHSPLERAYETATILLSDSGLKPILEPALIEIDLGEYEGQLESELRERYGARFDHWRSQRFAVAAPRGESFTQAVDRLRQDVRGILERAEREDILLIGHQAINAALKSLISGKEERVDVDSFFQTNDEIDIWDVARGVLIERLKL